MASLALALRALLGDPQVLDDQQQVERYVRDWTGRYIGHTPVVLRPRHTEEVAEALAWCDVRGVAVVPQGGNTGLVGGGVPMDGEVVLTLERLAGKVEVDAQAGQLTARAGCSLESVQGAAAGAGWTYGVDLAARSSATIGGTVATNAGGLHVLRWGSTRHQLRGIEAVLADGRVVSHLAGLDKDNTGYDLAGLMCGSEGTLGVVTAARLALVRTPVQRTVALVGFEGVVDAVASAFAWRRSVPEVSALEFFMRSGLELVCAELALGDPLGHPAAAYVLVETAGDHDQSTALAEAIAVAAGVVDVAVASSAATAAQLWRYREAHTEVLARLGALHKLDVSFPAPALADAIDELPRLVAMEAPEASTWLFGHVGDGNVHLNIAGLDPGHEHVVAEVFAYTASMGGSISAEHGIGRAKRPWLGLNRSDAELSAFRAIRRALDPNGILNPGVLV